MRGLMLLVLCSAASTGLGQTLQASTTWTTGAGANNHHYRLYAAPNGINWADAQTFAINLGGFLATINSADENTFVFSTLDLAFYSNVWYIDSPGNAIGPWLGGFQPAGAPEPAGGWEWVTSEPWSFTNWAAGEPNNVGGNENRLHYFGNGNNRVSTWNDIGEAALIRGFIVEIVPAPGSAALLGFAALSLVRRRR